MLSFKAISKGEGDIMKQAIKVLIVPLFFFMPVLMGMERMKTSESLEAWQAVIHDNVPKKSCTNSGGLIEDTKINTILAAVPPTIKFDDTVCSLALNSKNHLAVGGESTDIIIYDLLNDKRLHRFENPNQIIRGTGGGSMKGMAFKENNRLIAYRTWWHEWDLNTGELNQEYDRHLDSLQAIAFNENGEAIEIGFGKERDGLTIYSQNIDKKLMNIPYEGYGAVMAFSPQAGKLAIKAKGSKVGLWDAASEEEKAILEATLEHESNVTALLFNSQGTQLMVGCKDGNVYVWDVATKKVALTLPHHQKKSITALALKKHKLKDKLLAVGHHQDVTLWDIKRCRKIQKGLKNPKLTSRDHKQFIAEWVKVLRRNQTRSEQLKLKYQVSSNCPFDLSDPPEGTKKRSDWEKELIPYITSEAKKRKFEAFTEQSEAVKKIARECMEINQKTEKRDCHCSIM